MKSVILKRERQNQCHAKWERPKLSDTLPDLLPLNTSTTASEPIVVEIIVEVTTANVPHLHLLVLQLPALQLLALQLLALQLPALQLLALQLPSLQLLDLQLLALLLPVLHLLALQLPALQPLLLALQLPALRVPPIMPKRSPKANALPRQEEDDVVVVTVDPMADNRKRSPSVTLKKSKLAPKSPTDALSPNLLRHTVAVTYPSVTLASLPRRLERGRSTSQSILI
jgi:hypothetical protein